MRPVVSTLVRIEATILMCFLAVSCDKNCVLDTEVRAQAGAGAVDCGLVLLGGDRSTTDDCVVKAFQDGKPFYARYERQGKDSHVALGVARASDGRIIFLHYDGDPDGGGGDGRPVVDASVCEAPRVHSSASSRPTGTAPLECGGQIQLGRLCG
jgi:hypothetical protein